jgi:hypothetical protein
MSCRGDTLVLGSSLLILPLLGAAEFFVFKVQNRNDGCAFDNDIAGFESK